MNLLKEKVVSYLNMGLNPTVVGFQDNGLYYLFEKLLNGKQISNSYDPTFTFIHVALNYLPELTSQILEKEIDKELERDTYPGNTIFETLDNGIEVTCILDDLSFIEDAPKAIEISENLIRKYRGKVHFVYVVEDPLLIENLKDKLPAYSSFFDALVYQEIGISWQIDELAQILSEQYKAKLNDEELKQISLITNNHFGLFKRMYQDRVLNISSFQRYVDLLIDNLNPKVLNILRKVAKEQVLNLEEQNIVEYYKNINLIADNKVTIPILEENLKNIKIKGKVEIINEKLVGLDLNLLTKTEREIVEYLLKIEDGISRDEMAKLIWKDKVDEKFSAWALDQRIARLRRKFIDLGFNIDVQTIYGKGFKLIKVK